MRVSDRAPADITHTTLSVLFLALLIVATFWVLRPFATSILWATIVGVAVWPFLMRLESWLGGRRGLAVAIVTATVLLVVFVPVTLALNVIVKNAHNISTGIKSLESTVLPDPPAWIEDVPVGGQRMAERWRAFAALDAQQRSALLTPYLQNGLEWFAMKAGSLGAMLLQFLLTTIIAAILLANGEVARDGIVRFAGRLAGERGREVALLAARTIRGVVLGVVGTALIQTAIGGAGLFLTGIPGAPLLAAVMLFLCLAQLGPILVLAPAVGWLYWSGSSGWGTLLLVITIAAAAIDNVIRPLLIRRGANLPLLLIFAGVIGGLIAFGIIGLFIGPVVLTVTYTLFGAWVAQPAHEARL
jgi:predicted PurR-regulated permease PerM